MPLVFYALVSQRCALSESQAIVLGNFADLLEREVGRIGDDTDRKPLL